MNVWLTYLLRYLAYRFAIAPSAQSCIGKRVLVGITCLDNQETLIEQFQVHGRVARVGAREGIVITKPDGGEFIIPPNLDCLVPARPGQYTLRASGQVIENPDFLARLTLSGTTPDLIAQHKKFGFAGGFGEKR